MKKLIFFLSLIPITLTVLIFPYIQDDLILIVRILLYGLVVLSFVAIIISLFWLREKFLTLQAERKQKEHQTIQDGYGFIHLVNLANGHSQNLTLDARAYRNGHYEEPTNTELETFRSILMARHAASSRMIEQVALPATTIENVPELMTILKDAQRVLIKAISNGGKTTLLQHIADSRIKSESVLVLDSQSYPDKWPTKCKVIGAGSNHQVISIALDNLIELMVKRYQEIGQGLVKEGQHPKLTIIIDEWMAIVDECPNAGDVVRRLLTESRKAAFSIFIGSHSERVKSLGLDGRGDLRDGFLIVRLEIENGEHKATYDYGRGERPCLLPGNYISVERDDSTLEFLELKEPDVVIDKKLSERQLKILELVKQELSDNEIAIQVFKKPRLVGSHFYEVKEMRDLAATYT